MSQLTADQARTLAKQFHDVAVSVGNYRFNTPGLSQSEMQRLDNLQWTLLNYSSDFSTAAISITLDDLSSTLKSLGDATATLTAATKRIESIDRVLRVAGALSVLGAAIVTGNPGTIATAVENVVSVVSSPATTGANGDTAQAQTRGGQ